MDVRTCPSCRNYRYITDDGICRECATEDIPSEKFTRALRGMCAMTSLGMSLKESMHMISTEENRYGQIADEFEAVIDKTQSGKSIGKSLEECADETESEVLQEFYEDLSMATDRGKEHVHGYLLKTAKERI